MTEFINHLENARSEWFAFKEHFLKLRANYIHLWNSTKLLGYEDAETRDRNLLGIRNRLNEVESALWGVSGEGFAYSYNFMEIKRILRGIVSHVRDHTGDPKQYNNRQFYIQSSSLVDSLGKEVSRSTLGSSERDVLKNEIQELKKENVDLSRQIGDLNRLDSGQVALKEEIQRLKEELASREREREREINDPFSEEEITKTIEFVSESKEEIRKQIESQKRLKERWIASFGTRFPHATKLFSSLLDSSIRIREYEEENADDSDEEIFWE